MGNVIGPQIDGLFQIGKRFIQILPRQAVHEIEIQVVEADFMRRADRLAGIMSRMDASQALQMSIVEALDTDREPVDAGGAVAVETFPLKGAGIGFHRDFGIRPEGEVAA